MTTDEKQPDLVDRILGGLDHLLDIVHDKVLRPIFLAARLIAFGIIIVLALLVLISALVIGVVRLFDVYVFDGRVWITYAAIGGLSVIAGMFLWRKRATAINK